MLFVTTSWRLPSDKIEDSLPALRAMVTNTRSEPGCLACHYAFDILEPGRVISVVCFSDRLALDSHRDAVHTRDFRRFVKDVGVSDVILNELEVADARPKKLEDLLKEG